MMRGTDAASQRFLAAVDRLDRDLERIQRQVGSGRRIETPVDAPDDVSPALILRGRLESTLQTLRNLERVKTEVDSGESAIADVVEAMDRAVSLGTRGATETQTVAGRDGLGQQIQMILEEAVAASAIVIDGRHIFSGDNDGTAPYKLNLGLPNGVEDYQGSASTRRIAHPSGERFAVGRTAQQLFDEPGASVFAALNRLRAALANGPVEGSATYEADYAAQSDEIASAVADVKNAQNHLGRELAGFGAQQERVNHAINFANKEVVRHRTELSSLEDTDVTAAIIELQTAVVHRDAALGVRSKMPQGSLFDYL
ncbi:MAG TPA: flagellin [Bryobacteraceae bacterium]|nr:flagellin [Bryobacteraceae bacterium]